MKKKLAIIGSTGSIGVQTLDLIRDFPDMFGVEVLTAQDNSDLLIRQAREWLPNAVVIGNKSGYSKVVDALKPYPVKVYAGEESLSQIVEMASIDLVLNALVGYAGLKPTLHAIRAGKNVALANKEALVIAGDLVISEAKANNVWILPVDSEHSAIFQCLAGEGLDPVEKIYLTASGGPFRGRQRESLLHVTRAEALAHPNWKMGAKISVDSASMMNKGLEVIEAHWLFDLKPSQIDVVIHPQSIVHSLVQFVDGSIKAQMGLPDMKLPILYALAYPKRIPSILPRFDFANYPQLTFERPDKEVFRNLSLAYGALQQGGNMPCVLNAANEAAVDAFLKEQIEFLQLPLVVEHCLQTITHIQKPGYDDYVQTHAETLAKAREYVKKI